MHGLPMFPANRHPHVQLARQNAVLLRQIVQYETNFSAVELAIIRQMQAKPSWCTTNELVEQVGIAWETADKALRILFDKGYLVMGKRKNRIYWRLY